MAEITRDPFEEFEFRPINEGLGFHRKSKSSTSTIASGNSTSFNTNNGRGPQHKSNASFNINTSAPETKSPVTFTSPLPRNDYKTEFRTEQRSEISGAIRQSTPSSFNIPTIEDDSIAKAQTAVNEILKNLNQKRQMDFTTETEKAKIEFRKSRPILFAATLDGMLIVALFLLSMIAMLTITKVDLFLNLSHPETSQMIYVATSLLFIAVTFIYMVINRAFVGYTPGEWAFDQRLGKSQEIYDLSYIPKVAFRTILNIVTGFVVLPFISYLFNKDVAGQMTGLILYRHPNAQ